MSRFANLVRLLFMVELKITYQTMKTINQHISLDISLDSKTEKVTSLSHGRGTLTNK